MGIDRSRTPAVSVSEDRPLDGPIVAGFSEFGLAGLTAVDYLVEQYELPTAGHVRTDGLPSITPFTEGRPRHPTRLHGGDAAPVDALIGEQVVPIWAADDIGESITAWLETSAVEEVCVLSGVPIVHGPDDHRTFWIATEDFEERRVAGTDLPAMPNGFLDGVAASLLERAIGADVAVGVLVTPVHPRAPDAEAALRLLEGLVAAYDLEIDTGPLEDFAEDVRGYYEGLAARIEAEPDRDRPEDRMYM